MKMKELLLKYIDGSCTDQEKVEITNWLDSDPGNMKEYLALRKLNDISIWHAGFGNKQGHVGGKQERPMKKLYVEAFKIAAIFIFAFLILRYLIPGYMPNKSLAKTQTIRVPAGQRAEITMGDGTKVWLNAKTTFEFPTHFSKKARNVKLDGEGFFEVAHNKTKPFIVNTRKYNIKVLGTKFNLVAYSGSKDFEASLIEGSVEVIKQGEKKGIILKPNEQVCLKEEKMDIGRIKSMDHFLWREGIISFDNVTFTELVSKLEMYFDLEIEIKNHQILDSRYSGKFRMKDGVEHILKVLQLKDGFTYRKEEKQNKITIE